MFRRRRTDQGDPLFQRYHGHPAPVTAAMTAWPLADIGTEPPMPIGVEPDSMAMATADDAACAVAMLDALVDRSQGSSLPRIATTLSCAGFARQQVERVAARLYRDRQLAGYGDMICLPDRVAGMRQGWLVAAALAMPDRHAGDPVAMREAEAFGRLRAWTGWNMPVAFAAD